MSLPACRALLLAGACTLLPALAGVAPARAVTPGEATDLQVTGYDTGTGVLSISYVPACAATDHHIELGPLAGVATPVYSGQECGIGTGGTYAFDPGPGSVFFLVVGDDGAGTEGSYGTSLVGGVEAERPEDALDPSCSFVQDLSERCDGPFLPVVDLTAYRPASEAYGAPLQRAAVPDADEGTVGTGIRVNGDDDDLSGQADALETGVAGENDLIEVTVTLDPATPAPGYEYVLERSGPEIRVWNEATKLTEVIPSGNTAVLSPAGVTSTVWVESPAGGGVADLWLSARPTGGGPDVAGDLVRFYPFQGIVIALGGENQVPADPPADPGNQGTFDLAITLYHLGYDVHMYDEDVVPESGAGVAFDEVVSAIQHRGVTSVAIFGYSHGGGSTNDLAIRLDANRASIGTFSIDYTAYIDGIDNTNNFDTAAENEIPASTLFHDNYYERVCVIVFFFPLCGNSIPGSDLDLNINTTPWGAGLDHFAIDDAPEVLDGILNRFLTLPVNP